MVSVKTALSVLAPATYLWRQCLRRNPNLPWIISALAQTFVNLVTHLRQQRLLIIDKRDRAARWRAFKKNERAVAQTSNQAGTVECQVGSKTYKGEYTIVRGRVTVSCELGTKSGELKFFRPEFIAKTLLLELAENQPRR